MNRRPSVPGSDEKPANVVVRRSAIESTALLDRSLFSDAFDAVASRDSSDDHRAEQTDAERRVVLPADDDTGRYRLDELHDDLVDDLPDAHVSEFDVSDLDGDVVDIAATTIMQLPPSMIGHHSPDVVEEISVRKWSAGPATALPKPDANKTLGDDDDDDDNDEPELPPLTPQRRAALAPTMPFFAVPAVKAGFLVDTMPSLAEAPPTSPAVPTSIVTDVSTGEPSLRDTLDSALAALMAAQACADAGGVPRSLNAHLEKAVELLSQAIELAEED